MKSLRGAKYYVFFKDDYSKYHKVFFIKEKNEVSKCLRTFLHEVSTAGHRVKMFKCDGGKEFACEEVRRILSDSGITLLLSAPYVPGQNRVAGRKNHMVVELTWSMLSVSRLPKLMWAQACETAVYVLSHTGKSCYQKISNRNVEWSRDEELGSSTIYVCWAQSAMYTSQSSFGRNSTNKSVFGGMTGYLNDKDGYHIYVPLLKKIAHSYVYFKPEREIASVQWSTQGWKMQLWKMWLWRKGKKMVQCQSHHSQRNSLRWRLKKSFPGTQEDDQDALSSSQCGCHWETTFFCQRTLLLLVMEIQCHTGKL